MPDRPTSGAAGAVPQGTTPGPEAIAAFAPIDAKLDAIRRVRREEALAAEYPHYLLPVLNTHNRHDGFRVPVRVVEARKGRFGRRECLVEPVGGQGSRWVDANTLQTGQR